MQNSRRVPCHYHGKLELAERDYERLKSSIMNKDGNDTDDTSPTYKVLEEGANTLSKKKRQD